MPRFHGLTVPKLAEAVGYSPATLRTMAASRNTLYKVVDIEAGATHRRLTIPSKDLMSLQRAVLKQLFYVLPPHECLGHVRRRGVVWSLRRHPGQPYLLHVDISAFFPSVSPRRVEQALSALKARPEAAKVLSDLVTYRDELPQGAPTSVAVGDVVLYPLDQRIQGLADCHGLTYTRYVDDIILSGPGWAVQRFAPDVRAFVEEDGWHLSSEKGGLYGPNDSHRMLKAVVNRKPNVTGEYYAKVRDDLRRIARLGHRPRPKVLNSLASKVAWIATVNPDRHEGLLRLLSEASARVTVSSAP